MLCSEDGTNSILSLKSSSVIILVLSVKVEEEVGCGPRVWTSVACLPTSARLRRLTDSFAFVHTGTPSHDLAQCRVWSAKKRSIHPGWSSGVISSLFPRG